MKFFNAKNVYLANQIAGGGIFGATYLTATYCFFKIHGNNLYTQDMENKAKLQELNPGKQIVKKAMKVTIVKNGVGGGIWAPKQEWCVENIDPVSQIDTSKISK